VQFGFCAHHSTETAVTVFIEKVKHSLDTHSVVVAVFFFGFEKGI